MTKPSDTPRFKTVGEGYEQPKYPAACSFHPTTRVVDAEEYERVLRDLAAARALVHEHRSEFLGAIQRRVIELGVTPPAWPARNDIEAHDDVESAARMIVELCKDLAAARADCQRLNSLMDADELETAAILKHNVQALSACVAHTLELEADRDRLAAEVEKATEVADAYSEGVYSKSMLDAAAAIGKAISQDFRINELAAENAALREGLHLIEMETRDGGQWDAADVHDVAIAALAQVKEPRG